MIDIEMVDKTLETIDEWTRDAGTLSLDPYWDRVIKEFKKDYDDTEKYFLSCDSNKVELMSGYFEDIAYELKDQRFIELLYKIQEKFPDSDLKLEIQQAVDALEAALEK